MSNKCPTCENKIISKNAYIKKLKKDIDKIKKKIDRQRNIERELQLSRCR